MRFQIAGFVVLLGVSAFAASDHAAEVDSGAVFKLSPNSPTLRSAVDALWKSTANMTVYYTPTSEIEPRAARDAENIMEQQWHYSVRFRCGYGCEPYARVLRARLSGARLATGHCEMPFPLVFEFEPFEHFKPLTRFVVDKTGRCLVAGGKSYLLLDRDPLTDLVRQEISKIGLWQ